MAAPGIGTIPATGVELDVVQTALRDRVRWGLVIARVVSAFAVLLFLTVLGIALGLSALEGDDAATTVAEGDGPLNGFVAGAATLLLLIWMTTTAATGALGFFATTVADIAGAAAPVAMQAISDRIDA